MKSFVTSTIQAGLILLLIAPAFAQPLDIGTRLEPLVDDYLIDSMDNVELQLHHPIAREIALTTDAPWEGNTSCYVTVFQDGDLFRMYYRGSDYNVETKEHGGQRACYAESTDGIHWTKPELGIIEYKGSKANNIVWEGVHNFAPFKDANPDCAPEAQYKALATGPDKGLIAFQSPDGLHWSLIREEAVITEGAFDSQNLAFWDTVRGQYVDFHRGFNEGVRAIMTATSQDFINWTDPQWIKYAEGTPPEHLYTNATIAYPRAPHIFMAFPKRFVPDRKPVDHPVTGVSDAVFMTSRDGMQWNRWREALVRPGLQNTRWVNRNNMTAWGILRTKGTLPDTPDEYSLYLTEGYYVGPCHYRRFTIRQDGFVSVNAPAEGGSFTTKPLVFGDDPETKGAGEVELVINFSTSAAGTIRVELREESGAVIPGYSLNDCDEIYGDAIERVVTWGGNSELKDFAGKPVRLHVTMNEADLYAIRFR